jgi:PAS domain S-box-containing protein
MQNELYHLIRNNQDIFNFIEATVLDGIWSLDIQNNNTFKLSDKFWNTLGYTLEERTDNPSIIADLIVAEDIPRIQENLNRHIQDPNYPYDQAVRYRHKNGQIIWFRSRGMAIRNSNGEVLRIIGTHTNITPLKEKEALLEKYTAVKKQNQLLENNRFFVEQTPTAIAMFDKHMRYMAASEKWKADYGLSQTDIIGKSHYDVLPEIPDNWKAIHRQCLAGATEKCDEDRFVRADGSIQWLKWEIKPWYDEEGQVGGIIMFSDDLTPSKLLQEQLHISEQAFKDNFEHAAIGMALIDSDGRWLKINKTLTHIVGYTEEELRNLTFKDITHPDDLDSDLELFEEMLANKRSHYQLTKRYFHKDGSTVHIILAVSVVRDSSDKVLYFISQIIDITAVKTAERKLESTFRQLQSIYDASTHVSIISTDTRGTITNFNKGAENLLGYSKDEILFKTTPQLFHLQQEMEARKLSISHEYNIEASGFDVFVTPARLGIIDTREWTYVRKDGSQFPVQLTVTAMHTNGHITGYLGIAVDISSIKKVEREIQALLHVTQDQNQRLKNFAHIVSHNLRSHSSNMDMMIDLALMEQPELAEIQTIQLLKQAALNLKETITHLNEVVIMNTSTNAGGTPVNLHRAVNDTTQNIVALAKENKVNIINQVNASATIHGIPAYVDSIVLNFLTNAIKYRDPAKESFVRISSWQQDEYTVLAFEDNGIGIDLTRHKAKLFGLYKTFHNHPEARGIGLFITKNQVEAMGGKIQVESTAGKGTTFKIFLKHEKN